jgi:hypothetical protein
MGIPATIYHRPNGEQQSIIINDVDDLDAAWFKANHVRVSMEEDGTGGYILYGDYGASMEDGTPEEAIVFSGGKSCRDSLKSLREAIEELK